GAIPREQRERAKRQEIQKYKWSFDNRRQVKRESNDESLKRPRNLNLICNVRPEVWPGARRKEFQPDEIDLQLIFKPEFRAQPKAEAKEKCRDQEQHN